MNTNPKHAKTDHNGDPLHWRVGSLVIGLRNDPYADCTVYSYNSTSAAAVVRIDDREVFKPFSGETAREDAIRWAEDKAHELRRRS